MKTPASPNRIVSLDNVQENNIVYVDLSRKLTESIFEQQYRKAARIIGEIIFKSRPALEHQSAYCRNCKNRACYACKYRDRSSCSEGDMSIQNLTAFQTAIPFIGDRGTGKSSIMYSILERLKNYNGNNREAAFDLGHEFDSTRFITFDMIDANMLKRTDDVMEIILSRMLSYLEEFQTGDAFRDLYRQIDVLHEDLCLVHGDKKGKREEYGLASLQRVADSQKAIENFQKLVREFIQVMSTHKFNSNPCFMVVALDDIDMYQGSEWGMRDSQFALLEHIYSHMRIPGLIVLLTYNERLLKRTCNRHFEDIYFGDRKPAVLSSAEQRDIGGLTSQFMSKMFPMENRIYMPDYMLVDSADRPNLYVKPVFRGNIVPPFSSEQELIVKQFMLRMIAHKTGVYFDAAGTKKHFFEPRNLRDLGELFSFIYHMEDIPEQGKVEEQAWIRGKNRQELLNYLYNQFALQHLTEEEYEIFRSLSMLPLYRQDRTLVDMIRQQRMAITMDADDFGYLSKTKQDRWRYSYGELMNNIYFSTRIAKDSISTEPFFRKEFMHCIFGTHSVQLNETLCNSESRQSILKVIGSSVAGRWANKMLPKFWSEESDKPMGAGSISLPIRNYFDWEIPGDVQRALWLIHTDDNAAQEQVRLFLEALVIAGMFFTSFPSHGLGISLDAKFDRDMQPILYLYSASNEHICFNVMNFVINLYDALPDEENGREGYLNYIQGKLQKLGHDFAKMSSTDWEAYKRDKEHRLSVLDEELKSKRNPMMRELIRSEYDTISRELGHLEAWHELQKRWWEVWPEDQELYFQKWDQLLRGVIRDFSRSIRSWQSNHKGYPLVLPVQNFDMMYNILKRLANVSYHDIPDDAPVEEVFDYYAHLYRSMEEELRSQDRAYFGNENGFSKALRDSLFYRIATAEQETNRYNPHLKHVMISMIRATIRPQGSRKSAYDISIL